MRASFLSALLFDGFKVEVKSKPEATLGLHLFYMPPPHFPYGNLPIGPMDRARLAHGAGPKEPPGGQRAPGAAGAEAAGGLAAARGASV